VTGKITYQGQAVPGAYVTFANVTSAASAADGTYKVTGVPVGEGVASVVLPAALAGDSRSRGEVMVPPPGAAAPPGKQGGSGGMVNAPTMQIPGQIVNKYKDPTTSGLKLDVKTGENSLPIELQ
jgi:hypothetical protein